LRTSLVNKLVIYMYMQIYRYMFQKKGNFSKTGGLFFPGFGNGNI
jgi:hypothetical protein